MKRARVYLFAFAALLCGPMQSLAEQAAKVTTLDQKKTAKVAQVIQNQLKGLVQKKTVAIKGIDFSFDVPTKQFDCLVADNSCVCTMFFNARYLDTDEYRNILMRFYPARINSVVYEPENARLAFSGAAGFMESASEDRMLVDAKELEKELSSHDADKPGYIYFSSQGAGQSSKTVTAAMKNLVSLCGGSLAAR